MKGLGTFRSLVASVGTLFHHDKKLAQKVLDDKVAAPSTRRIAEDDNQPYDRKKKRRGNREPRLKRRSSLNWPLLVWQRKDPRTGKPVKGGSYLNKPLSRKCFKRLCPDANVYDIVKGQR